MRGALSEVRRSTGEAICGCLQSKLSASVGLRHARRRRARRLGARARGSMGFADLMWSREPSVVGPARHQVTQIDYEGVLVGGGGYVDPCARRTWVGLTLMLTLTLTHGLRVTDQSSRGRVAPITWSPPGKAPPRRRMVSEP